MMDKPTISACVIVGDDRDSNLMRCLDSVKGAVDEIIVVHTGCSVKTRTIISQYTDRIYHLKWKNSFSDARNYSIGKATCDWILYIDSDEYLVNPGLIRLGLKPGDKAYLLRVNHVDDKNSIIVAEGITRVFRNGCNFRFFGDIHEIIEDEDGCEVVGANEIQGPVIFHTGYSNDKVMREKTLRNFELLKAYVEKNPGRRINYFFLARDYYNLARYEVIERGMLTEGALDFLRKSIEMAEKFSSMKGGRRFEDTAVELRDLCRMTLLFKDRHEVVNMLKEPLST